MEVIKDIEIRRIFLPEDAERILQMQAQARRGNWHTD